jgi:hypothetical protein
MSPPRVPSADKSRQQSASQIASAIETFFAQYEEAAVLEDGKVIFDLRTAKYSLNTGHDRCTLHLWSDERNLVRNIVAASEQRGALRLDTMRFGHTQTKLLELVASHETRTPTTKDGARTQYLPVLERVLIHAFSDWRPDNFRTAMDLEKSFGPAYARGSLVKANHAWAVIAINENETSVTIDGILTLGILWLDHCRERAAARRLYQGLKIIVPRGTAMLTLSRLAWLNTSTAQWELYELDQRSEELVQHDAADQGNLRTRLLHHPDEATTQERFATAIAQVFTLVPKGEEQRVEQRLRSTAELAFLLHGMEFARARIGLAPNSFAQTLEITVGAGTYERPLTAANTAMLAQHVAELFERRRAGEVVASFATRGASSARRIGAPMIAPAHSRMRPRARTTVTDPLYRAVPERWLESVLRQDLAPLTRSLAPKLDGASSRSTVTFESDIDPNLDPDTLGNRADPAPRQEQQDPESRVIPRLDPRHVYAQVPAIAGASDRGMLDLLGVTADGRLAIIELKAADDLHFALQGLDYWIRVRHHHLQTADAATGLGEFQRHGYFRGVELSPLPPRLYLVAPALHIHSATETILRYLSPRVEWHLLALDERWRQQVRVIWRKSGGIMGL